MKLRLFISHSSGDEALVRELVPMLDAALKKIRPEARTMIDIEALKAGRDWRGDIDHMMLKSNCALVLLTPSVLARPEWVRKETNYFQPLSRGNTAWFRLWFACESTVTDDAMAKAGLPANDFKEKQRLNTRVSHENLAALVKELCDSIVATPARTDNDPMIPVLEQLLAEESYASFRGALADALGLDVPTVLGAEGAEIVASQVAEQVVQRRREGKRLEELLKGYTFPRLEDEARMVKLLSPLWVRTDRADALMGHIPRRPVGRGAVVRIAGDHVPTFTGNMYVRRALGEKQVRMLRIGGLVGGGDFASIRDSLCNTARRLRGGSANDTDAGCIEWLNEPGPPTCVLLTVLPDPSTCTKLREVFPRVLFIAPRPIDDDGPPVADGSAHEIPIDPWSPTDRQSYRERELLEFEDWSAYFPPP